MAGFCKKSFLGALVISVTIVSGLYGQDAPSTPNLFPDGNMDDFTMLDNPWGGVDAAGNLRGLLVGQLAVDDNGAIKGANISPGIALGDLNGDGLTDLVLADPKGFIWFFPNSGTKTAPKFTSGEVMPIWLGSLPTEQQAAADDFNRDGADHLAPRIQLIDFDGDGKLDIVAGTFTGNLFYIRNTGSLTQPMFATPKDLSQLKSVQTRSDGRLDCNYLSPFLYDWYANGHLHLIKGDGTYAANSIIFLTNKGANAEPVFNEVDRFKIIPGMGREHLTPIVMDWNNDGKPDIITGERSGQIELFLNIGPDRQHPKFDEGQKLKFGGQDKFGQFTTVASGALSGNPKAPDIIFSNDTGEVFYCHNTGAPGSPDFSTKPQVLKGTNPLPKTMVSKSWAFGWWHRSRPYPLQGWSEGAPFGVPYELLGIANAQKEPDFAPPDGVTWKNALKYEVVDHKNVYFTDSYYPKDEDAAQMHSILSTNYVSMESETQYQISFWIKGQGVRDLSYRFHGGQNKAPDLNQKDVNYHLSLNWFDIKKPVSVSPTWNKITETVSWNSTTSKKHDNVGFVFRIDFYGQGSLYLSDMQLHKM